MSVKNLEKLSRSFSLILIIKENLELNLRMIFLRKNNNLVKDKYQ